MYYKLIPRSLQGCSFSFLFFFFFFFFSRSDSSCLYSIFARLLGAHACRGVGLREDGRCVAGVSWLRVRGLHLLDWDSRCFYIC